MRISLLRGVRLIEVDILWRFLQWNVPYYRKLTLHEIKVLEINAT